MRARRHLGFGLVVVCLVAAGQGCSSPSPSGTDAKVTTDAASDRKDATADNRADSGGGTGGASVVGDAATGGAGGAAGSGDAATEAGTDAGKDVTPNGDGRDAIAEAAADTGAGTDAGTDSGPPAPTCTDHVKNGNETDIDCGGSQCPRCGGKKICGVNGDCVFNVCRNGICDECAAPADCPGSDTECRHRTCTTGTCGVASTAVDVALPQQSPGDCKVRVCKADGTVDENKVDITDTRDEPNPCTADTCTTTGTLVHTPIIGASCGTGGLLKCNAAGQCVNCLADSDCPADSPATACRKPLCRTDGTCGFTILLPPNTKLTDPTAGDCHTPACNAAGQVQTIVDTSDKPDDQNPCTIDNCGLDGVASHAPVASGASCPGGRFCDGANNCVQCVSAGTCTGTVNECQTRTCINNACGVGSLPTSTVLSQTANDCTTRSCNGAGAVTTSANAQDLPLTDNNPCTDEVCNGTTPAHPLFPVNHVCGTAPDGHSLLCNATGACVGCLAPSDCPGTDTECHTRTCISNSCGIQNLPTTTALTQTLGDCQARTCDGAGNVRVDPDTQDLPADDTNPCTSEACNGATPTHPLIPATPKHACGTNLFCDGAGACVACVVAGDCPGTDTECHQRTCINHSCGIDNLPTTTVLSQTLGDCKNRSCDGAGNVKVDPDGLDLPPADQSLCTDEVCIGDTPSHPPFPLLPRHTCGPNLFCDGAGTCIGCLTAADCPGTDSECLTRVCDQATRSCTPIIAAAGTSSRTPIPGNCASEQCDGQGGLSNPPDLNDPAIDANQCTDDVCATNPHPAKAAGTPCNQGGGQLCNGDPANPLCVDCVADTDCNQTTDTTCNKVHCLSNHCTNVAEPSDTVIPDLNRGDCQHTVCISGFETTVDDPTDAPPSTKQCVTSFTCVGTTPMPNYQTHGTTCTDDGGRTCDYAGNCLLTFSVLRIGPPTPAAALSAVAAPVFVEERKFSDGSLVGSAVALPTAEGPSSVHSFTLGGTATSDGGMSLSANGKVLILPGYNALPGAGAVTSTNAATTSRMIATVDASANVDSSTLFGAGVFTGNNIRGAASDDGLSFWAGGAGGATAGIWYITRGQTPPAPVQVFSTFATRWPLIIDGQLYASSNQGVTSPVLAVGTGLPTTAGQTATSLPGMPTGSGPSPFSFVAFDRDPNVPGIDLLYVTDDAIAAATRGIQRWTATMNTALPPVKVWSNLVGVTAMNFSLVAGSTAVGFRGLTGLITGGDITLIATSGEANANVDRIVKFVDVGGTSNAPTVMGTLLTTAPTNQVFRGVALAPHL